MASGHFQTYLHMVVKVLRAWQMSLFAHGLSGNFLLLLEEILLWAYVIFFFPSGHEWTEPVLCHFLSAA